MRWIDEAAPGLLEGMILSTCNRVEVAVTADDESGAEESVEHFLAESRSVTREWVVPYLYKHDGPNAIRHLFAWRPAWIRWWWANRRFSVSSRPHTRWRKSAGTVSGFLDLVMTRAFNVAKRVRSETDIGSSAVSVSYAAVELAREIFGSLAGKRVLLVGAGKMAESAARHLKRAGVSKSW
jgi:glutamyl-tRNA reductase